jgi:hypothetical protein
MTISYRQDSSARLFFLINRGKLTYIASRQTDSYLLFVFPECAIGQNKDGV